MNNNKQTAVEWLIEQLHLENSQINKPIFDKAKAMEKEQIIKAYTNGSPEFFDMAKEYYNETYGK